MDETGFFHDTREVKLKTLRYDARTYVARGIIENGRRLRRIAVTEANRGVEEWYRPSSFSIPSSSFRGLPETAAET